MVIAMFCSRGYTSNVDMFSDIIYIKGFYMISQFKSEGFLRAYIGLSLHDRINTKFIEFRAIANGINRDFNEFYLCELLPKTEVVRR